MSKCPTCNDTGSWKDSVGYEYCCCPAGTKRRGNPGFHKWVDASLGQVCSRCWVHSSEPQQSQTDSAKGAI